jgi:predicted nuclease with TOPRIM domain
MATTLEDLDRRATALERTQGETTETLRWVVTKLACMQAVQDEHTLRLERLETKFDKLESKVDKLESKVDKLESKVDGIGHKLDGLIESLPGIVSEAIRAAR